MEKLCSFISLLAASGSSTSACWTTANSKFFFASAAAVFFAAAAPPPPPAEFTCFRSFSFTHLPVKRATIMRSAASLSGTAFWSGFALSFVKSLANCRGSAVRLLASNELHRWRTNSSSVEKIPCRRKGRNSFSRNPHSSSLLRSQMVGPAFALAVRAPEEELPLPAAPFLFVAPPPPPFWCPQLAECGPRPPKISRHNRFSKQHVPLTTLSANWTSSGQRQRKRMIGARSVSAAQFCMASSSIGFRRALRPVPEAVFGSSDPSCASKYAYLWTPQTTTKSACSRQGVMIRFSFCPSAARCLPPSSPSSPSIMQSESPSSSTSIFSHL
mmetsp:Transcript_25632/g.64582  ORF Transcript_25632/g.64582 Transcript_25632/m.64582 type:complete len:328 (+) Transcript_25632:3646-4629(+)